MNESIRKKISGTRDALAERYFVMPSKLLTGTKTKIEAEHTITYTSVTKNLSRNKIFSFRNWKGKMLLKISYFPIPRTHILIMLICLLCGYRFLIIFLEKDDTYYFFIINKASNNVSPCYFFFRKKFCPHQKMILDITTVF